ncbi:hypothetical protein HMPREF9123_2588 [Neisseria bacilliformis ATCC BAA-1200]|uniref:Uncharacterized protein n=1 Tax=Neisseria bacilliformis ATCC BAA-1200 TaxID=888742 RepID=F2BFT1_9NEIS|nr:hypothetical protein HMPREF9123_2588 [Neisseria bacilliformis ATCC BAA-1200]
MCRPKATHAFSAASQNPCRPQTPKPRAWLRHTPYGWFDIAQQAADFGHRGRVCGASHARGFGRSEAV